MGKGKTDIPTRATHLECCTAIIVKIEKNAHNI